mgnify:CR=1 FL=1
MSGAKGMMMLAGAAIGLACGAGYYIIAGIALVFTIVILTLLGLAERAIKRTLE